MVAALGQISPFQSVGWPLRRRERVDAAAARARISLDPRRPEAEEPATAVCCVRRGRSGSFLFEPAAEGTTAVG